nr:PqqD family peptide modification chaperone [Erythrobacter sp. F6033]
MSLHEGSFSSLTQTGLRIWSMMEDPILVSDICARLLEEFDVEKSECEAQTIGFLQSLRNKGFIEVS